MIVFRRVAIYTTVEKITNNLFMAIYQEEECKLSVHLIGSKLRKADVHTCKIASGCGSFQLCERKEARLRARSNTNWGMHNLKRGIKI